MKNLFLLAFLVCATLFTSCRKQPTAEFSLKQYEYQAGDAIVFDNISIDYKSCKWEIINDNRVTVSTIEGNHPNIVTDIMAEDGVYTLRLTAYSKKEKKSAVTERTFLIKSVRNYLTINQSGGGNHDDYTVYVDGQLIGESFSNGAFQAKIPVGLRIVKLVAAYNAETVTSLRDLNSDVSMSF